MKDRSKYNNELFAFRFNEGPAVDYTLPRMFTTTVTLLTQHFVNIFFVNVRISYILDFAYLILSLNEIQPLTGPTH